MYITENGLSCNDKVYLDGQVHDADRIDFTARYLLALSAGIAQGADVRCPSPFRLGLFTKTPFQNPPCLCDNEWYHPRFCRTGPGPVRRYPMPGPAALPTQKG